MRRLSSFLLFLSALVLLAPQIAQCTEATEGRWSAEKAKQWYDEQPWLVGCNFSPSTAINQLEMWQSETFDPETIDRELGYAASLGMNTVRTYLHDLAWQADPVGFIYRWGTKEGAPEPELWHHDLLRKDGTPFDAAEAALFRELTQVDAEQR